MDEQALAILNEVLACPEPAERARLIERRCEGQPALLARVQALLAQVTETAIDPDRRFHIDPARARLGQQIGPFRLVEVLGHGGMGVVYLAERADAGFEQRVALKLIRADTPVLAERFLRERRILARLNHPGIAHLVDGGFTEQGQAWFAMEYVDGESITQHSDHHRLGLRARVELLCQVGTAVQFAHGNLVVHRDLKPANILVDASGASKLLDFGIARLLDETEAAANPTLSLTPAYASPEQMRGEPISTACDIYQLGLVLYELLSGIPAHSARTRAIRDDGSLLPVPPPDLALRDLAQKEPQRAAQIASVRRLTPERLQRQLRGDLGRILAKALAIHPRQRYDSAADLMRDLQCWLAGLPVRAHRGHWGYRTRKFLRRHWVGSAAVALFVLGIAYHLVQLDASNQHIRAERDQAQAIAGFMQELFSAADPRMQPRAETTARELLSLGADRLGQTTAMAGATRANLLATVARSFQSIGQYDDARDLYQQALSLLDPERHQHRQAYAQILASASQADTEGNYPDNAEAHYEASTRLLDRIDARDGIAYAYALGAAAGSLLNLRRFEEAAKHYELLLLQRGRLFQLDPKFFCEALLKSAGTLEILREPELAMKRTSEAVDAYKLAYGSSHPDYGQALAQLADQQTDLRQYADAERNYREGISILRETLGDDHRDVGIKLNNQALMYIRLGRFDEAITLLEEALPILREVFGPGNAYVAAGLYNNGSALIGQGHHTQASLVLAEARRIIEGSPQSTYYPRVRHAQAQLDCAMGDLDAALAGFEHARQGYGDDRLRQPALRWHRADCLLRHGRIDEARVLLPDAIAGLRTGLGAEAWDTRQAEQAWQRLQAAKPP